MQFSSSDLLLLNLTIAAMMFGVSLQLKVADFARLLTSPKAPVIGLIAQFMLLPALTCGLTWLFNIDPELALGMILVASCPGGTFSNIMTWIGRGSVAVSVTMTAISSLAAVVMTPFNFAFYGWLNPSTRTILTDISVSPWQLLGLVVLVLGVPIALGMFVGRRYPHLALRSDKPMRIASLSVFLIFVALAFIKNRALLADAMAMVVPLVIAHNFIALSIGALSARVAKLNIAERRAVTMEVGIQNSGLGLTILFTFFPNSSGMILIAACWGVWHLISGLSLAYFWSRRDPDSYAPELLNNKVPL
ncbi:MAG: bile acid:sodium symporter family protein [Gammaproteobacteria bacterium]|nr:bile acid:sodium symporter family protein [Gammaproteobacteria bacterium]MBQ0775546.1 bile acid:sodium symporter family protein [Gammaproteobacteria bacterium]